MLYQKALHLHRKLLGEQHPYAARSYNNLARNLEAQGRYAEAQPHYQKALDLHRKLLGEEHLDTARSYNNLAGNLHAQGRYGEAEGHWVKAAVRFSAARLGIARSGLERATVTSEQSPLGFLAGVLARNGPAGGQVFERVAIQKSLPADAGLLAWLDIDVHPKAKDPNGEHWAVLLRSAGEPVWAKLPGSGPKGDWTKEDSQLPRLVRDALQNPKAAWQPLSKKLRRQRLEPLQKYLAANNGLPAVKRLIGLPSTIMAGVPVEVFAEEYTVSYALSGTMYAHLRKQPPLKSDGLLVLADPVLDRVGQAFQPDLPRLPPHGLFIAQVVPGSNAFHAGLKSGDVLLRYADTDLKPPADLSNLMESQSGAKEVTVTFWREGKTGTRLLKPGKLGVALANSSAPEYLAEKHKADQLLASLRSGDDGKWQQLPGTRVEAESLRKLFGKQATILTDSQASEQVLDKLATGELAKYRYIHLATHGVVDERRPLMSAVILSRDDLPDPDQQLVKNLPIYDGRLTAEEVLQKWNLNAELVTLSACQTALGKYERGEGFVGFAQAMFLAGSRSVCLSLWKVDDTATALLMDRFYANLLKGRASAKRQAGMTKAEALAEAKSWLRNLTQAGAAKRVASLTIGVARGKNRPALPLLPSVPASPEPRESRPYAHPYYWAAFVLIGDEE